MVQTAVERFGRLDVLVNNAGTTIKQPEEYTLEEWHLLPINSAFMCSQAAYPAMQRTGGGKIVMIGSMMSIFGASFTAPYAATKGGIVQLAKALACAWAKDNIQVNAVLPGWIDSALTRRARRDIAGLEERVVARTPAGRWGTPDDFAGVAVFLRARPRTSSPARRSRSTAATRSRLRLGWRKARAPARRSVSAPRATESMRPAARTADQLVGRLLKRARRHQGKCAQVRDLLAGLPASPRVATPPT